jgi:hypothetical protein
MFDDGIQTIANAPRQRPAAQAKRDDTKRVCEDSGKTSFPLEQAAWDEVERAWTDASWKNRHGGMPINVYRCDFCKGWHLTKRRYEDE